MMDWIRLTKSGKDLTGTGGKMLRVTKKQLAKHNKRSDAWMALNGNNVQMSARPNHIAILLSLSGKVYNVTSYMDFHPGGWDELVRGAGIDATDLFNEVHRWVNYESMLQACLVGKLVEEEPDVASVSSANSKRSDSRASLSSGQKPGKINMPLVFVGCLESVVLSAAFYSLLNRVL